MGARDGCHTSHWMDGCLMMGAAFTFAQLCCSDGCLMGPTFRIVALLPLGHRLPGTYAMRECEGWPILKGGTYLVA